MGHHSFHARMDYQSFPPKALVFLVPCVRRSFQAEIDKVLNSHHDGRFRCGLEGFIIAITEVEVYYDPMQVVVCEECC